MTAPPPQPPRRSTLARWGWPIAITVILALSAGANIGILLLARSDKAFAIEPDYYDKAIRWDDAMAQQRRNLELGWRADAALALARPGRPGTLSVRIRDAAGQPLTGAEVRVEALHNARAAQRYPAELTEGAAGEYRTPTDAHRPGEWEVRVTAQRGPDRFTTVLRLTAGTPS